MCYPSSDLIGHGDKKIATRLYEPSHGATCDIHDARQGTNVIDDVNGTEKPWLFAREESMMCTDGLVCGVQ